jgi:hypothetical protein
MKSRYVFTMTRNSAILTEFDPSSRISVKNAIVILVEAHINTQLNILHIVKADVGIAAGSIFNLY